MARVVQKLLKIQKSFPRGSKFFAAIYKKEHFARIGAIRLAHSIRFYIKIRRQFTLAFKHWELLINLKIIQIIGSRKFAKMISLSKQWFLIVEICKFAICKHRIVPFLYHILITKLYSKTYIQLYKIDFIQNSLQFFFVK